MLQPLAPHPETPCPAIERIEAEVGEARHGGLRVHYCMVGDADRILAAPLAPGVQRQRRDELWRHTCCELFVRDAAGSGYREYNFAPNGDWAAYGFTDYRTGMERFEAAAPRVVLERSPTALALTVILDDLPLEVLRARRIGIACIVETPTEVSYWALAHPPGRPDFHHARTFALALAPEHTVSIG